MIQFKIYKIDKDGKEVLQEFEKKRGDKKDKHSDFYHKADAERAIKNPGTYIIKQFHIINK